VLKALFRICVFGGNKEEVVLLHSCSLYCVFKELVLFADKLCKIIEHHADVSFSEQGDECICIKYKIIHY